MSTPEESLAALGRGLPEVPPPAAAYVPAVRTGPYVYTAGQLPLVGGTLPVTGKVGAEVTVEQAQNQAATCAVNALAAVAGEVGALTAIRRIVKVVGFVASAPDFTAQPRVLDGASELLREVLGAAGRHARSAVGMAVLPFDSPVEVELIADTEVASGPAQTASPPV